MEPPITTRVALLQALRDAPGYGQDLIRRVAEITGGALRLSAARVYPCLHSLEREGLVISSSVTPGRKRGARSRTYYELTLSGIEASCAHRRVLEAIVRRSGRAVLPSNARFMAERLIAADELSGSASLLREAMRRSEQHGPG